jgi:hypothetical protein
MSLKHLTLVLPQLVLADDIGEGVELLVVIVGVAHVVEGVGGVDGLVRYGRSHLFVKRRRPNAARRFDRLIINYYRCQNKKSSRDENFSTSYHK